MRPKRLYTKIFFSFLLVLVVAEILIFGLFIAAVGREFRTRMEHAKALLLKEVIEEKINSRLEAPLAENESLRDFLIRFDKALGAYVWVTESGGTQRVKSFEGSLPARLDTFSETRLKDFGDFKVSYCEKGPHDLYAIIPIEVSTGDHLDLHVLYRQRRAGHPAAGFAIGLAIIGGVIALLIIPISRFITRPIRELENSALRIAEGDLSHRARVKRNDEIGELGRAFNHMAQRLERMIRGGRELTANVSHELRSPLARIRVAAELLRDKLEKGEIDQWMRHMDAIGEDIEELDRLIGRILDLSKLEIHEKTIRVEEVNLVDIISGQLEKLKSVIERKGLNVRTDLPARQVFRGDRETMGMAFSNLLDNAVKFIPESGLLVLSMVPEEDTLVIRFSNTFQPIPEDELTEIFEPFHRLPGGESRGSGLGLAITKKVIEKHDGTIAAANTNEGLTIEIRLPNNPPEITS
jgi:two-component system sensor histidine kinase CpxA